MMTCTDPSGRSTAPAIAVPVLMMLAALVLAPARPVAAQDPDPGETVSCLGVNVIKLEDVVFGNAGGTWEYEGVKNGLPVVNVVRGSPAAMIGVRTGDFIVALNGKPVYLPAELVSRVQSQPVGERFSLEIYRRGEVMTATGILGVRVGNLCQPTAGQAPNR